MSPDWSVRLDALGHTNKYKRILLKRKKSKNTNANIVDSV